MNPFATDPHGAGLSPDFVQRLDQALATLGVLNAPVPVLQLWHAWREPLEAARDAVLHRLQGRGERAHVCQAGDFLPLLQTLNTLIADSLRGAPLPTAQQLGVWVVDDAQALTAPHAALIERVLTHFPEVPLRLVLMSQTLLAPLAPVSAQTLEVLWREAAPASPEWTPEEDEAPPARAGHARLAWGLGTAVLLALAGGAAWWVGAGVRTPHELPVAVAPASAPAVTQASGALTPASEAASVPDAAASAAPAAVASAPAPQALAPAAVASAPVAKAAPRSPLQDWVQTLPEGSWLVLHAQFSSPREAEAFKATDPLLANARIAQAVWATGQPARYGVLTGPFRSPERASNYLQRLAWRDQAHSIGREALLDLLKP